MGLNLIIWTLAVHLAAARTAPVAYLTALWWRLRGKRLRARLQLAPLLGRSTQAYWLWQAREERGPSVKGADPAIVALVDVGAGSEAGERRLEATLHSLAAEGVSALVIGAPYGALPAEAAARIDWTRRPWLMPLAAGDVLALGAGEAYRTAASEGQGSVLYADDDLLDHADRRTTPHFKSDWNAELFQHFDYLSGACIVRATRPELERLDVEADWACELVSRAVGEWPPLHIRRVLHHRRARPLPRVPATSKTPKQDLPPVSVIVPTRNCAELLEICLTGLAVTAYPDLEIIVVDNDSDDPRTLSLLERLDPAQCRVLRHPGPFNFSAINNRAAAEARGQVLCLLNNDIEVIEPGWLATMVAQALREDVGAVGARLLYPNGLVQHAGVVLGIAGAAAHAHRLLRPGEEGYFRRHDLPQFVSAVTAACLVVRRDRFLAIGGFNERDFAVSFNDVDLCMRLGRRSWRTLYEPRATLIHHESMSRGLDHDLVGAGRLAGEIAALRREWSTDELIDPFHHPELSPFSERFVVRV